MPILLMLAPVGRFLKSIPWWAFVAVAALIAAFLWHRGEVRDARREGVATERAAWEKVAAKQAAAAAVVAAERDAAVRAADVAGSLARRSVEALAARGRDEVRSYYVQNPDANRVCLNPDRLRSIAESDAAAMDAARTAR